MGLRKFFDDLHPHFAKGGKYEKYYPIYEMIETGIFTPRTTTTMAPHIRDYVDTKRVMSWVVLATLPAILFALWNTGFQANQALASVGASDIGGWRAWVMDLFGVSYNADSIGASMFLGALYFLPIYLVTLIVGGIIEVFVAVVRGHEVTEGFLVTSMLYTLTLPATIPLWQVALGIAFGVIIGKEVFGGQGKNFMNPALTGRAFLYFAYPAQISGNAVWVPVDGYTGATALGRYAEGGAETLNLDWWNAFYGIMQGSMGETSTLAILIGGMFLLITRIANWRLVAGCILGTVVFAELFNAIGSETNPMFQMEWYWHMVIGGYAFGLFFMVTEPVSGAMTNKGSLDVWFPNRCNGCSNPCC